MLTASRASVVCGGVPVPRAVVAWSSGKDSAYALLETRRRGLADVVAVLTTVGAESRRVAMHGVSASLLDRQVAALGLPSIRAAIPDPCPNDVYDRAMATALAEARTLGATHVVFGDLFLADIRAYREERLAAAGMHGLFPLWGRNTRALAHEIVAAGIEALVCCVDPRRLDASFAGRRYDADLLAALPAEVDPCAERGEFHTVVTGAPVFDRRIPAHVGPPYERGGFLFVDVTPADAEGGSEAHGPSSPRAA